MIIVEGPDGAGKTTLVNELVDSLGLKVRDRGPRENMGMDSKQKEYLYQGIAAAVLGHSPPLIYDRLYYSELVYGKLWRDNVIFGEWEQSYITGVFRALRCPVIFCMPPFGIVRENIDNDRDKQLRKVPETISEVYDEYGQKKREAQAAAVNVISYDYTAHSLDKIVDRVQQYINNRRLREW